ncbi:uncharacterized protein LOC141686271 [Apium graveolens]|uniref:uncharacterized protein LOC141686271 n=1 Tax=Apium graveolens TaxID=4045 RepID=UPI003D7B8F7E
MEKLAYALVLASRKLRPYFQAHKVEVCTSYPLRQVLHNLKASGRLMKWAIELGQFDLDYKPRTAIKGQALADFLLEFSETFSVEGNKCAAEPKMKIQDEENCSPWWTLYVDGVVNEYEALIAGLKLALEMKVKDLNVYSDSTLVVWHIRGGFQARGIHLEKIPRTGNSDADALAKLGSQKEATLLGVIPLEVQQQLSIPEMEAATIEAAAEGTWISPIMTT